MIQKNLKKKINLTLRDQTLIFKSLQKVKAQTSSSPKACTTSDSTPIQFELSPLKVKNVLTSIKINKNQIKIKNSKSYQ